MLQLQVDLRPGLFSRKQDAVVQFTNWYLRQLSENIKDTARTLAPTGATNRLERSITVWDENGETAANPSQQDTEEKRGLTYYVGTDLFYSFFQELGYTERDGDANAGNPFLRPAFYQEVPKAMTKIPRPFQVVVDES